MKTAIVRIFGLFSIFLISVPALGGECYEPSIQVQCSDGHWVTSTACSAHCPRNAFCTKPYCNGTVITDAKCGCGAKEVEEDLESSHQL